MWWFDWTCIHRRRQNIINSTWLLWVNEILGNVNGAICMDHLFSWDPVKVDCSGINVYGVKWMTYLLFLPFTFPLIRNKTNQAYCFKNNSDWFICFWEIVIKRVLGVADYGRSTLSDDCTVKENKAL